MEQEKRKKIDELKAKAEFFLENDLQAFIKDINDTWYFCDILIVGEIKLSIYNFEGQRKKEKDNLLWIDIKSIDEYKERPK